MTLARDGTAKQHDAIREKEMEIMAKNYRLGGWLAVFGATLGVLGSYLIFINWYTPALTAEAAEPGCELLLKYLMPALLDFGILAGVLYAVSAYGFFTAAGWAFPIVVIANILALQGSWFLNVPFMAAGLPPIYFTIFFPNIALFFLFMRPVGKLPWNRIILGLVTGMAFIFCFMNGVASWSRILTTGTHIFIAVQRLNWVAFVGMGVVTMGVLLRPREWVRVLGMSAASLELFVGIPLAVLTTISLGRFSMFSLGPILSLILLVIFAVPSFWKRATGEDVEKAIVQGA